LYFLNDCIATTFSLHLVLTEEINITAVIKNGNFTSNFNQLHVVKYENVH